jgi:2-hydroxy-6-oxonona-2,4-dienedioate hydrolase
MKTEDCSTLTMIVDERPVCVRRLLPTQDRGAGLELPWLLVHGLGCSREAWIPALDFLQRQGAERPVYAPDMPGSGSSPGPPETLGMPALADWSARLLDALGIARAHVGGNSMGCQVALALARRHPERVGGLVLAGPTTGEHFLPRWRYLLGLVVDGVREPPRYNATLARMCLQMGMRRYLVTVQKMLEDDPVDGAGLVRAPCLIVRGGRDAIVPAAAAQKLASALPHGAYTEVPAAAHAVQFNEPELFCRKAGAFLAETGIPAVPTPAQERVTAG